ncbi:Sugar phosphate isomerase/epimerase [bacterium A37T11]|nr:Sugar phosphate isomerase/epimerase [bacterium A37T11]
MQRVLTAMVLLTAIGFTSKVYSQTYPETKLGWKLGTQTYTFKKFTFFEAVDKAISCGVSYIEAYPGQNLGGGLEGTMDFKMPLAQREAILKKLKEKKITLVAFGVVNADNAEEWKQLFDFAKAMGVKNINTEPKDADLPLIGQLANQYKILVSFHNHPNPSHYWSPQIVLDAIAKTNSKYVGSCADVGHWLRSGLDPLTCIKQLKGHINHLHFKDLNEKGPDAHDVPWGTGVLGVNTILEELKRQKFKGMFSAEYEYNWDNNQPEVKQSVENFRKIVTEL